MKKVFGHLIVPCYDACFARLRTDDNVYNGFVRIGQLMLETKINNRFFIVAKITDKPAKVRDINWFAQGLVNDLKERITQYEEGLICAAEFLNEAVDSSDNWHDEAEHSSCRMRITHCDEYCCPAVKAPGSEKETERQEQFIRDYNAR